MLGRPYRWSILGHGLFVALVLTVGLHSASAKKEATQRVAARAHEAIYHYTASTTYAERLKRIHQLVEQLDAGERKKTMSDAPLSLATPQQIPSASPQDHSEPVSATKAEPDMSELWRESRKLYEAVRTRYIEQKAKKLSAATQIGMEKAREKVAGEFKDKGTPGGHGEAPSSASEAASGIAGMHGDAQRMLNETMRDAKARGEGHGVDLDTTREAYRLGQNQAGSSSASTLDDVVDWTPFMMSGVPRVNSILDTPEDQQRFAALSNVQLRRRFQKTRQAIRFTRRLGGADAVAGAWATPDAWYIIGPFPNPRRENIETSYPPEIEIDRDAVYEGRAGRMVAWQYVRPSRLNVRPPDMKDFGVYYAFTEITCAAPTDCWLAIGSDDFSKLWVNGLLVWRGSKNEKVWDPTEGFRRVHLDAGVTRLLLRLENGINGCEFSVLIALE